MWIIKLIWVRITKRVIRELMATDIKNRRSGRTRMQAAVYVDEMRLGAYILVVDHSNTTSGLMNLLNVMGELAANKGFKLIYNRPNQFAIRARVHMEEWVA